MKKLALIAPALALVAVACSGGAGGGAAGGGSMKAGQWEITMKMTDVEVPGAPPAVAEQMKAQMAGQTQTQSQCLTDAELANMGNRMGNAGAQGGNCNFTKTTFGGGTIDIAGTCQSPTGNATIAMTGTTAAETFEAATTFEAAAGPQTVKASGTISGRRTGDCAAK